MRLSQSTFAEAWKDEFDRKSAEIEWFAMTVAGRARILNQFKEDAMHAATVKVRRREVLRCAPADLESIERKFRRRAHRLGVSRAALRQYE
jgi:5-methylthioribose kinase